MQLHHVKGNTWYLDGMETIPLYRLDSSRCILLDPGRFSERKELKETLERENLHPVGVIGSHFHDDHTANMFWLREHYGTRTCLSKIGAGIAENMLISRLSYFNLPVSILFSGTDGARYSDVSCLGAADEVIDPHDGEFLFYEVPFRIIHTPGHSPDQICIVTPDNVCYAADCFLSPSLLASAKLPFYLHHVSTRNSMQKLHSMTFDSVLVAHTGIVEDLPGTIDKNLALLDSLCEEVLAFLDSPKSLHEINVYIVEQKKLLSLQQE